MNLSGMRYRFTLRYCLSLLVVVGGLGGLLGQNMYERVSPLKGAFAGSKQSSTKSAVCVDDAGEITSFSNVNVSSNSFPGVAAGGTVLFDQKPRLIFLCAGDFFNVDFDESSANVSGDADPTTRPGIAYSVYSCQPTVTGPTASDLLTDDCLYDIGIPQYDDSLALIAPNGYYNDPPDWDLRVFNSLTPTPPGFPQYFVFAPITVDSFDIGNNAFQSESVVDSITGAVLVPECVNVSTSEFFTVVFLDIITASRLSQSSADCSGSFVISGGLPQYTGNSEYTKIKIVNRANPAIKGSTDRAEATYFDGDVVNYTVPEPGEYEIIIEDGVSCDLNGVFVTHTAACPPPPPTANLTFTVNPEPVTCSGDDDGTLAVTVTGGTGPYDVIYRRTNPAPTTATTVTLAAEGELRIPNLRTGFYEVSVRDNNGEVADTQRDIRIDEGNPFSINIETIAGSDCNDSNEATLSVVVIASGDTIQNPSSNGYTILWSNGEVTQTINATPNRNYGVSVTNIASQCEKVASATPAQASTLVIDVNRSPINSATCSGSEDGTITVQATGGSPGSNGYTFNWSDGFPSQRGTSATRENLNPGEYTVEVVDNAGCSDIRTFTVAAAKTLLAEVDSTNVTCFGNGDGSVSVTASTAPSGSGPTLPFQVSLLNSDSSATVPSRTLSGNGSSPFVFKDLVPGSYIVVLQDSDPEGCKIQQAITITEPELLEITAVNTTDVGCPDEAGTATIDVTGGTGPYTYRFRNDSLPNPADSTLTFDSTTVVSTTVDSTMLNTIGDLQADTNYVVFVTDSRGCVDSMTFFINSPPRATIQPIVPATVSCPESTDGQLTVVATPPQGDTIEITIDKYEWFRLNPDNTLGEKVADGRTTGADLTVGAYVVQITLSNDCTSFGFGQVSSPGLVMIDSITTIDPSCIDDNNGSAFVSASGGTKPYTYRFSSASGPSAINNVNGLVPLDYTVTVTDANGCEPIAEGSFTINAPVSIVALPTITDVNCPSDSIFDGSITYDARFSNDSIGLFEFIWSTGDTVRNQTSATLNGLARGPVSVTITDGFCPQVFTDTIGSPEDFAFDIETESVTCNGLENGAAQIDVTGGTPAYTFEYVGRTETGTTLTDVPAGAYQLIVTDSRGCVADTFAFGIDEPDPLVLAIDQDLTTPLVTCAGDEDGIVAVQIVSNNNNPLAIAPYSWSDNVTDDDDEVARNLSPGLYSVTVTDSLGCQDSVSYTILDPQPIFFTLDDVLPPNCFGETTEITIDTAFGGQSSGLDDFTFTINNDGFLIRADQPGTTFAGETIITVFDSVGCTAQDTFDIRQPDEIIIDLEDRIVIELGDSLQQLNPIITPPNGEYAYRWTPDRFLSSDSIRNPFIFPTSDQEYTFEVTDSSGCSALEDVFVIVDANRNIYIPNGFSPNGDGRNDDFRIFGCRGVVGITQVNIFNRWGGLVYENSDLLANCLDGTLLWNGNNATLQGKPVDPGVYVYTIEVLFLDNETLTYRGDILVIR